MAISALIVYTPCFVSGYDLKLHFLVNQNAHFGGTKIILTKHHFKAHKARIFNSGKGKQGGQAPT